MKKIFTIIAAVLLAVSVFAQAPQKMSYQAVIRNSNNTLVISKEISMQISILQGSVTGTAVYIETQTPSTNANGLVSLEIGNGTPETGIFANINWSNGPYFIKIETDPTGGTNYTITGTTELMSVPYAFYAKTSGSSTPGPKGDQGIQGETGLTGAKGEKGDQGIQGEIGLTGTKGDKGEQGIQGETGLTGAKGEQGLQGETGLTGAKGDKGDQGLQGEKGETGADGLTTSVNGVTQVSGAITLTKANIGLANVDNTTDSEKPISNATQTSLDLKVDKVTGKSLSTEDYTTAEKTKLAGIVAADGSETKLTAGTNIKITGSGTTINPYVINAIASFSQEQRDALTPVEGLIIYNSTTKKPNFYNGNAWMNYDGSFAIPLAIGDTFQGGKIAYILQAGDPGYIVGETHGFIAAPSDQSTSIQWCDIWPYPATGGTAVELGTGNANTNAIVASQGGGNYAAKLCADLILNGFNDWYLPSRDELSKLYLNRVAIGGFTNGIYWSSTEYNTNNAWVQNISAISLGYDLKNGTRYVRAIRSF